MKLTKILCIAASAAVLATSCGSKNNTDESVEYTVASGDILPVGYQNGPDRITPEQLHELILMPDDLTPGQAVGALNYLNTLIQSATGNQRDVLMREFVDFYGIVAEAHPDEVRDAIQKLKKRSGIDLKTIFDDYSLTLRVGDDDGTGDPEAEQTAPKPDTVATPNAETEAATPTSIDVEPEATISTFGE